MVGSNKVCIGIPRRGYGLLTLRIIPKGDKVPKVLIHLLFRILGRHTSWLRARSVTITSCLIVHVPCYWDVLSQEILHSSNVRYRISDHWLSWSGWPVSPTYLKARPPTRNWVFYVGRLTRGTNLHLKYFSSSITVELVSSISIGYVLHLGAPQRVARRLVWSDCYSRTNWDPLGSWDDGKQLTAEGRVPPVIVPRCEG